MSTRIAFWGTPSVTTAYLDKLSESGMTPVVIVTNPDRPKGRGQELSMPPAKVWALAHGVPVLQPEILDDAFYDALKSYEIDLSVVVAYGSILKERFIALPLHKTLNVHYSLLPRYRGAAPVEAAILSGEIETGCAVQVMAQALDSGPIIGERRLAIGPDEKAPELRARLTALGAELLTEIIPKYLSGAIIPMPQDEALATRFGKIKKEDGLINLADDPLQNYQKFRAYFEWPRTYFFIAQGEKKLRVIITRARMENNAFIIERVLPEGRKEVSYEEFLRAYPQGHSA